jgi:hypothetical protein
MAVAAAGAWVTFKQGFTRMSPYMLSTPLFIDWTLASSFCACGGMRLSLRCGGGITLGLRKPLATTAGLLALDWRLQEKPQE